MASIKQAMKKAKLDHDTLVATYAPDEETEFVEEIAALRIGGQQQPSHPSKAVRTYHSRKRKPIIRYTGKAEECPEKITYSTPLSDAIVKMNDYRTTHGTIPIHQREDLTDEAKIELIRRKLKAVYAKMEETRPKVQIMEDATPKYTYTHSYSRGKVPRPPTPGPVDKEEEDQHEDDDEEEENENEEDENEEEEQLAKEEYPDDDFPYPDAEEESSDVMMMDVDF